MGMHTAARDRRFSLGVPWWRLGRRRDDEMVPDVPLEPLPAPLVDEYGRCPSCGHLQCFTCPRCGCVTYEMLDVLHGYCPECDTWTGRGVYPQFAGRGV